jgi:hypothetical protein
VYYLDSGQGRRRRSIARDKAVSLIRRTGKRLQIGARDVSNRINGFVAEARHFVPHDSPGDDILVSRVRAAIGHVCRHPHAVEVGVMDGIATLRGPVRRDEIKLLLTRVLGVDGIKKVENGLWLEKRRAA